MDLARFEAIVRDPRRTRTDIETMWRHALDKNEIECAEIASEVLCSRFPARSRRGGGPTPTAARFLEETREFGSGKEAYLWLVTRFTEYHSGVIDRYVALHQRAGGRSKGCRFARNSSDLFPKGSKRRGDSSYYAKLGLVWFADINLSHDDKFATLLQLSYCSDLEYGEHWEFRVEGETDRLREHQKAVLRARELLDELVYIY